MKISLAAVLLAAVFAAGCAARVRHAHWDGRVWVCPPGTDTWVDENEAINGGHHPVYCVPQTKAERDGVR